MVATHQSGRFEGIVLDVATGTVVDGGLQLVIGSATVTDFQGVAGIPCGTDSFTLDFSPTAGPMSRSLADGTFTTSVAITYTDGTNNLFTTNWTLTGARAADGTWSGTLKSDTTGGVNVGGYNYRRATPSASSGTGARPGRAATRRAAGAGPAHPGSQKVSSTRPPAEVAGGRGRIRADHRAGREAA